MATVPKPPVVKDSVPTHGRRTPKYIVLHTTESFSTVANLARFFRGTPDQLGASYIVQTNGRIGECAGLYDMTYHVRRHNSEMLGIEQAGLASTSRIVWLTRYRRQLMKTAWLLAWLSQELDIPLIVAGNERRQLTHTKGVLQHRWVPDNDHVDCGSGYPIDYVMDKAVRWKKMGGPTKATRAFLHTGVWPKKAA